MNPIEYTPPTVDGGESSFGILTTDSQTGKQYNTATASNKQWISSATSCNGLWQQAATSSNSHWQPGATGKNSKSNEHAYSFTADVASPKGLFPKTVAFVFPGQNRPFSLPFPSQYFPTKPSLYTF
jgi:hypothetical protein